MSEERKKEVAQEQVGSKGGEAKQVQYSSQEEVIDGEEPEDIADQDMHDMYDGD